MSARSLVHEMRPVWSNSAMPSAGLAADPAIGRVVDQEIELRPVLRRLADIADIGIGPQMREFLLDRRGEQALVDADVLDAGFRDLLVERVHQLFVVGVPRMLREFLVGVVADRIALPRIRLEALDRLVDLVEPAGPARGEGEMRQHAARAGLLVDGCAGLEHLRLRDEPVFRHFRRRVGQQRHLGVAVHIDFFHVIVEFQILDASVPSRPATCSSPHLPTASRP